MRRAKAILRSGTTWLAFMVKVMALISELAFFLDRFFFGEACASRPWANKKRRFCHDAGVSLSESAGEILSKACGSRPIGPLCPPCQL